EDDAAVADAAMGGARLGAVEDPAAVGALGAAAGAGGVRARSRLGEAPGADLLALRQRRHPAPPLLLVAILEDVVRAQRVVRGDADAHRGIDARKLRDDDDVFDVAEPGAAVLLRKDDAEEAQLPRLRHHLARELLALVDLVDERVHLAAGELPRGLLNGALLLGERKVHERSSSGPRRWYQKGSCRLWRHALRSLTPCPPLPDGRGGTIQNRNCRQRRRGLGNTLHLRPPSPVRERGTGGEASKRRSLQPSRPSCILSPCL